MNWYTRLIGATYGNGQADYDRDDHAGEGTGAELATPAEYAREVTEREACDAFSGEHLTEPLVGWKGLCAQADGYLMSARAGDSTTGWQPLTRNESHCLRHPLFGYDLYGRYRGEERHASPDPDCNCGWHAALTLDEAKGYSGGREGLVSVVAQVYLWGRCIINETGYRAQYAYPKHAFLVRFSDTTADLDRIAMRVYARYGIPCGVIRYDDLLDWVACEMMGLAR